MNNNTILGSLHLASADRENNAWVITLNDRLGLIPKQGTVAILGWGMMMTAQGEVGFGAFSDY
jgi:hypothetical protein